MTRTLAGMLLPVHRSASGPARDRAAGEVGARPVRGQLALIVLLVLLAALAAGYAVAAGWLVLQVASALTG